MTQYSYSRVSLFNDCPYHYDIKYHQRLTEITKFDADNPLLIGSALHKGIEMDVKSAVQSYYDSFPVITDRIVEEAMKLEILIPKVKDFLEEYFDGLEFIHEYKIDHEDYIGYVDLIVKHPDGHCDVIDFKYSNHVKNYVKSGQLHIYKHHLEQDGFNVKNLGYLFVPKTSVKLTKSEELHHFRKRLIKGVKSSEVKFLPIAYDQKHVEEFNQSIEKIEHTQDFSERNTSGNCFACNPRFEPDYLEIIKNYKGEEIMKLPSSQRRNVEKVTKRVFWLYGAPFSGKTTFANKFPNPLMLNTDGNIRFVDAPYISIANEVESTGRVTNTTLAWDIFKDTIRELEKKDNEFKTIIVDLLEDTYEACRLYMYDKLGIEHEADNSFKAWDMVRTEYLSTIKRIIHLDYENIIFISHEDTTKDVTKRSGDKITSIKPNLQEKASLKVAGMVDIVGRVIAEDSERKIEFKSKNYVFSGGRLPNLPVSEIDLDVDELFAVYDKANANLHASKPKKSEAAVEEETPKRSRNKSQEEPTVFEEITYYHAEDEDYIMFDSGDKIPSYFNPSNVITKEEFDEATTEQEEVAEEKPKRQRKSRKKEEDEAPQEEETKPKRERKRRAPVEDDTPPGEEAAPEEEEEQPQRTRRRRTPTAN